MSDTREPKAIIEAAEQAANSGDFAAAERLLRKAAELQETNHGPLHPDLANTFNNLGVVAEMNGNVEEAERCFRRAYEIASSVLAPDHPVVATSRKNLEDFCAARGRPLVSAAADEARALTTAPSEPVVTPPPTTPASIPEPPAPIAMPTPPAPVAAPPVAALPVAGPRVAAPPVAARLEPRYSQPDPEPVAEAPRGTPLNARRLETIAIAVVVGVLALVALYRLLVPSGAPEATPPSRPAETAQASPPASNSAPSATAPTDAKPSPRPPKPAPSPTTKPVPAPKTTPARTAPVTDTVAVSVVSAEMCRNLTTGSWRCDALSSPAAPGQVFFYTRVKSARDTVVLHRWFRDQRMIKSSELTIRANPSAGYRTYSRNTVGSGNWRVELRTKSGELLQEEQFTVR